MLSKKPIPATTKRKSNSEDSFTEDEGSSSLTKLDGEYGCDQCGYKTKFKQNLKPHIKAKHDGIKFPCSVCDYKASFKNSLKMHNRSKHGGLNY